MSELYQAVNERRVFCGRCRHEVHQSRMPGGPFDGPGVFTYTCGDCSAIYGVCETCAAYLEDGITCYACHTKAEGAAMLPDDIDEQDLVRDPSGRANHWYHPATDTVFAMPFGWKPAAPKDNGKAEVKSAPKDNGKGKTVKPKEALLSLEGKAVIVTGGRFEGKKGVISEIGQDGDTFGVRVLLGGDGTETPFDGIGTDLRLLTPEEVATDDAALKKQGK